MTGSCWLKKSFQWLAFAFALFSLQTAWASHGRSIDIQWTIPDASKPREVEFTVTYIARRSFWGSSPSPMIEDLRIRNSSGTILKDLSVSLAPEGSGVDAMVGTAGYDGNYVLGEKCIRGRRHLHRHL